MIAKTSERVVKHTNPEINLRIQERTQARIARLASQGPDAIRRRLDALDSEWDIERVVELQASVLTLASMIIAGVKRERRWFMLGGLAQGFMLQHAVQGWCPPIPALRWMGFRTAREIEEEREALQALDS